MTKVLELSPVASVAGTIKLPGSKSISNRTLLLAALSHGKTMIRDLLSSDDTARMLEALQTLGVKLEQLSQNDWLIHGCAGQFPQRQASLFLGNAGTAFRPLTAALAFAGGEYQLSGVARMHERPIADLVDALKQAGAKIEYLQQTGFPPLAIHSAELHDQLKLSIRGNVSSQFLTALLMALPMTGKAAEIVVEGELISKPYIDITLNLMRRFGVDVKVEGEMQRFIIASGLQYQSPSEIYVEGDASSASYFFAAGTLAAQRHPVRVEGISQNSIQGDIRFLDEIIKMGALVEYIDNAVIIKAASRPLKALDLDCNHIPDAAMTLAVMALFADGTSTLRNIASWRVKETDRISAMATELRKVGAQVEEGADFIRITPPSELIANARIDTYDDHRMAMCFSLVSLGGVPVTINDPDCVAKTFPDYFSRFADICQR